MIKIRLQGLPDEVAEFVDALERTGCVLERSEPYANRAPAAAIAPASASYPAASAGNRRDRTLRPLQSRTHSQCESAWVCFVKRI